MAITKIGTDIIANDAITADKIAAGALDTQLAGYLSTNSFATESYVGTAISNLVDSSPATLDTLNELAAALGDDPNFATTTATAIGLKAPIASPSFTGAATFSGNVGIAGQASPTYKLDGGFADQTWGWYLNSSYNAGFTFNTTERSLLIHTKSAENIDHIKFATSSTGTERMRIDSGGLLLLNETSSRGTNVVGKMQTQGIHTFTTINNEVAGFVGLNSNADNSLAIGADPDNLRAGSHIIFYMDGLNEKMRLDASGNLLVGTTDDAVWNNTTGNGINLRGDLGLIASARTNAESAMFNRIGTDGEVIKINKDGATVGSIGSRLGAGITIDSGGTTDGVLKNNGAESFGWNAGYFYSRTDNSKDLGLSVLRWKDLYLSGGVYLGGTGAANKLDDYEEGTWTPTINVGTIAASEATYTKIGNQVHLRANIGNISDNSSTSSIAIGGLPFAKSSGDRSLGSCMYRYFSKTNAGQMNTYIGQSSSSISLYWSFDQGTGWASVSFQDGSQANMDVIFTLTYTAT